MFFNLTALNPFEDFKTHAVLCDELLQHYTQQFRDREIYWMSREYSRSHEGLITVIIDSYDKAKLSLPRWPFGRVPKKSIYEETRRCLIILETFLFKKNHTLVCDVCELSSMSKIVEGLNKCSNHPGTYLTLTAVICHGWGCYMYLSNEALTEGSNWNWECAPWPHFCTPNFTDLPKLFFHWGICCIVSSCDPWMKFTREQVNLQNHFLLSSLATVWVCVYSV